MKIKVPSFLKAGGDGEAASAPPELATEKEKVSPNVARGRSEFTNVFGDLAKGKRNWQLMAFALALILLIVIGAYIHLSAQSRVETKFVKVDEMGQHQILSEATSEPPSPAVHLVMQNFIRRVRSVYASEAASADIAKRAYQITRGEAQEMMRGYFGDEETDPRRLSETMERSVEVQSILPVPNSNTYRVRWTEETDFEQGLDKKEAWEGYLTISIRSPATPEEFRQSPVGVWITEIEWGQVSQESE